MSYSVNHAQNIYRPKDKQNYSGQFPRDAQERLTSCKLYKPTLDIHANPAPNETDSWYQYERKSKVASMVKEMTLLSSGNGFNYGMKRLPTLKKKKAGHDLYQSTSITYESKETKKKKVRMMERSFDAEWLATKSQSDLKASAGSK